MRCGTPFVYRLFNTITPSIDFFSDTQIYESLITILNFGFIIQCGLKPSRVLKKFFFFRPNSASPQKDINTI